MSRLLQSSTRRDQRVKPSEPERWTPLVEHEGAPGGYACPSQTYRGDLFYVGHVCGPWCGHDEDGSAEWCACPAHQHRRHEGECCKHRTAARVQFQREWEQAEYARAAPLRAVQARVIAEFDAPAYQFPRVSPARAATLRLLADDETPFTEVVP